MTSSLIPERPLQISPSLAATIGLEEATLLTLLSELAEYREAQWRQGVQWYLLDEGMVAAKMPFWTDHDVQRISQSLRAKGVILLQSAPFCQSRQLVFAFNEQQIQGAPASAVTAGAERGIPVVNPPQAARQVAPNGVVNGVVGNGAAGQAPNQAPNQASNYTRAAQTQPIQPIARGATVMPPHWQPSAETLAHIAQHNIPEQFVRDQLPEFVNFWRESGESHRSWGAKFQQQVLRKWREHENFTASREQEIPMSASWRPSQDAMEVLVTHAAINPQFIEDAIPEFVLFWRERGDVSRTWNSKFIQHVRRQWARYSSALEHDTEPRRIPETWQPGDDVYDVLRLANIDVTYAQSLVPEFVIFWRDSNQVHNSWNTKFLQHVKRYWAQRHALGSSQGNHYAGQQAAPQSGRTKDRSLAEDLTDRSWAL